VFVCIFKIKAGNQGNTPTGTQTAGSGFQTGTDTVSRATKIFKIYIKGNKFSRNNTITYEAGTSQVKFFDYHLLYYAYSNWSTSATLGFNVARINDEVIQMYYKDALKKFKKIILIIWSITPTAECDLNNHK